MRFAAGFLTRHGAGEQIHRIANQSCSFGRVTKALALPSKKLLSHAMHRSPRQLK